MQYPLENSFHFFFILYYTADTEDSCNRLKKNLQFSWKMVYCYNIILEVAAGDSRYSPVGSRPRGGRRTTSDSHLDYN